MIGPLRRALRSRARRARSGADARRIVRRAIPVALALAWPFAASLAAGPAGAAARVLDDFESSSAWTALPASGVAMKLTSEPGPHGRCLRVDFDFQKGGGYAVLHRSLPLVLPANYRFAIRVRGECGPENFEFKLLAPGGDDVWWCNRRDFVFPREWTTVATRARQIEFAWGPTGGGTLRDVAAIEFAITAGSGGAGTVWLDDLTLEELAPPSATPPPIAATGSRSRPDGPPARAVDGDSTRAWRPAGTGPAWLELDLGELREFGGLTLDWDPRARPARYDVRVAADGGDFRTIREVREAGGERDWLFLPESEARRIRVEFPSLPAGAALRELTVQPIAFGRSPNDFWRAIATREPRGRFPRGIRGEMQRWSAVGSPGGLDEAFFSEDGAIDLGTARPSIEPFLWSEGRLWAWADVSTRPSLVDDALPLPRLEWLGAPVALAIEPVVVAEAAAPGGNGGPGTDRLEVRYRLLNPSSVRKRGRLFLAIRPFQVNPPAQFLNTPGGVVGLASLVTSPTGARLDTLREVTVQPRATASGAAIFDAGDVTRFLAADRVPPRAAVRDPSGHASGALAWDFDLAPGDSMEVRLSARLAPPGPAAAPFPSGRAAERAVAAWRAELGDTRIVLPPAAREIERTLRAQIGWIGVNRDGPAIQPGSRAYARSWIRDGSLTCSALLRWGRFDEVRRFLEWFAPYQYPDGKVPCCVDHRGSDPVPEHDSHGEFIYLVADYVRMTGDTTTLARLWPHVAAAAAYLDTLRAQRLGPEWSAPDRREFRGLLPPSISHEGYSAKPMHSYWDDFWAVRGYQDAAFLARLRGDRGAQSRFERSLAAFRRDFAASIAAAQKRHAIAYVPGCADLGDFDATSTTIALSPVQAGDLAPEGSIPATFDRYWNFFVRRRDGTEPWQAFTPYEIRNIGAFVRLGWRSRAQELIDWFLAEREPPGWAQWSEVVYHAPGEARFLGDIPHTWVGSDFVRSVLDCFAYERERDDALVVAAGVADAWVREGDGLRVEHLHTRWGALSYRMRAQRGGLRLEVDAGLRVPAGGLVVLAPGIGESGHALVNGRPAAVGPGGAVVIRTLPATVLLSP